MRAAAFVSPPRERTSVWASAASTGVVTTATASAAPGASSSHSEEATPKGRGESVDSGVAAQSAATGHASSPLAVPPATVLPPQVLGGNVAAGPVGSMQQREAVEAGSRVAIPYDVLLGSTTDSPQYGLLGEVNGRKVALDLNQTHTISLFGVQGGGKSYTLGTIAEMASLQIPQINVLPRPLAAVIFHYSPTMDYKPEFTSMVEPNSEPDQLRSLKETYGAEPAAISDVLLLVPKDKVDERRAEYPSITVAPLQFGAQELKAAHWKFLMGAVGSQATYIRQVMRVMKGMRDDITLSGLRAGVEASAIPDHLKDLARTRLDFAAEYIADGGSVGEAVRPGRLIIVDVRDEFIEKDEALGLFVVMLQLFADAKVDGQAFNKLVVFDEAHKYIESPDLVAGLIEVVREMRHKGVSIMVASQDPPSVPVSLIELSTQVIMHKFNSPAWLKHIQKANAALANLTPERMAALKAGEAFVWSSKASDDSFSKGAMRIRCRPRVTQHGGATRVAVEG